MTVENLSASPETILAPLIFATKMLKKEILGSQEKGIIEAPKLTEDKKAAFFDYQDKLGNKWEIVTRKDGDKFSVRVKKRLKGVDGKEGRYTQKNGNSDIFTISANDKAQFNIQLGKILDSTIGSKNRDVLPKTGETVFNMLTNKSESNNSNNKKNGKGEKEQNKESTNVESIKGLTLDHGTYVYEVQPGDTESGIKAKLSKYGPLKYISNISSDITGLNFSSIPDNKLQVGLKILIPPKNKEIGISDFKTTQKNALNAMKSNAKYGAKIKELIKKYGETHIVNVMTAYAKSESSTENSNNIGNCALFRYETFYKCCSYGYHHVLYEGVGKACFKNLGFTLGQTAVPKDSGMLFLAFCIEKANGNTKPENKDFTKFFDMNNTGRCGACYNGKSEYGDKLKSNFKQVCKYK